MSTWIEKHINTIDAKIENNLLHLRPIEVSNKKPLLLLSGPSAAGKTTIAEFLDNMFPNTYDIIPSYSTRPPRPEEIAKNNYPYIQVSRQEFEQKIKDNTILEYAEYGGNYYGKDRLQYEQTTKIPLLVVEMIGVKNITKMATNYNPMFVFVVTHSRDTLEERINKRGDTHRLNNLDSEIADIVLANYVALTDNNYPFKVTREIHSTLLRSMAPLPRISNLDNFGL